MKIECLKDLVSLDGFLTCQECGKSNETLKIITLSRSEFIICEECRGKLISLITP